MPYYFPDDLKECYRLIGKFKNPSNGKITHQEYFAYDEGRSLCMAKTIYTKVP
jgi:hypothetical protein